MIIPDNRPDLPSYKSLLYREIESQLQFVLDAWVGKRAWTTSHLDSLTSPGKFSVQRSTTPVSVNPTNNAGLYLPQEEKETKSAYSRRLTRSLYKNFFKKIITAYASLFANFEMIGTPPLTFEEWWDDVDMKGNTFQAFMKEANAIALRDGFVGIWVDYTQLPKDEEGNPITINRLEAEILEPRPFLKLVYRANIPNWRIERRGSRYEFSQITMTEVSIVDDPDSTYGEIEQTRWRRMTPDEWVELEIIEDETGKLVEQVVDRGVNTLGVVPIVLYTLTNSDPINPDSSLPMYELAELTFSYYQIYSDYREIIHKCNLPLPIRKGVVDPTGTPLSGRNEGLVLGGYVIDIPDTGDFFFAEPAGTALEATRAELLDLAKDIKDEGLSFISRSDSERTATEVSLDSTQVKSVVEGMAEMSESGIEQVLQFWSLWDGSSGDGGSVSINRERLEPAIEAQAAMVYNDLYTSGTISREAVLTELKVKGFFSKNFDVEKEMARQPEGVLNEGAAYGAGQGGGNDNEDGLD